MSFMKLHRKEILIWKSKRSLVGLNVNLINELDRSIMFFLPITYLLYAMLWWYTIVPPTATTPTATVELQIMQQGSSKRIKSLVNRTTNEANHVSMYCYVLPCFAFYFQYRQTI